MLDADGFAVRRRIATGRPGGLGSMKPRRSALRYQTSQCTIGNAGYQRAHLAYLGRRGTRRAAAHCSSWPSPSTWTCWSREGASRRAGFFTDVGRGLAREPRLRQDAVRWLRKAEDTAPQRMEFGSRLGNGRLPAWPGNRHGWRPGTAGHGRSYGRAALTYAHHGASSVHFTVVKFSVAVPPSFVLRDRTRRTTYAPTPPGRGTDGHGRRAGQ